MIRINPSEGAHSAFTRARELLDSDPQAALALASDVAALIPDEPAVHRLIALAHRALGQVAEAETAELAAIRASVNDPELQKAAIALAGNALHIAEPILRNRLKAQPTDVAAIRMLAELAGRIDRNRDAEALLRRALTLAPAFTAARANLATVLHRLNRTGEALAELDQLLDADSGNPALGSQKAALLGRVGDFEEAIALYEDVIAKRPEHPKIWMSYGHALKTVGRRDDAIAAYRRAIAIRPQLGEAWWSLANLKTITFDQDDIAAMEAALAAPMIDQEDRLHLEFALGKGHEDCGTTSAAFDHYARGNAIRREQLGYDADDMTRQVDRMIGLLTPALFAERCGQGSTSADPIFILGMPRAGSTLIEQILSCHSMVEGTMELHDIPTLTGHAAKVVGRYPQDIAALDAETLQALGDDYIARTRIQRREGKPHFIDKLPNNWLHSGFIHLILPNARIIDARRHPLDCCFSNYRQHFARGQDFSYGLEDVGRYYADYVRFMAHIDRVLPGRVHRVVHERLVEAPEREIERLLAALGLPFEEACLRFHESGRAVRTASSEQVRRPINRDGMDQWQPHEARLGPLKAALGAVLTDYPAVPPL